MVEPEKIPAKQEPLPAILAKPKPPLANAAADEFCEQAADEFYQGNYWAAVQNCKKALELRQDYKTYHLMGKALSKHSGFKYDAMKAYKAAQELNPKCLLVQKDIADLYLASDNKVMALSAYKKILAKDPTDEDCKQKIKEIEHGNDVGKLIIKKLGGLFHGKTKH